MKNFFKIFNNLSSGGALVSALMLTNFFNFLFNAILGRVLTLEQFSLFTLANTLWFLITIFLNSIASTTNNRTAYLLGKRGDIVAAGFRNFIFKKGFMIAIFLTLVWILFIPILANLFHTTDYLIFIILTPTISWGILSAINRGFFQGTFSFAKAAIVILSESISKFFITLLIIFLGYKEFAFISIPFSILIALFISQIFIRRIKIPKKIEHPYIFPKNLLIATFLTTLSSAAFLSVDLLLARLYLPVRESGEYALLSLIGKMIYFFGGILNVFILTLASRDTGLNKNSAINFYKILTSDILLLIIGFIGLGIFGNFTVPLLFGNKSLSILQFLLPYSLGIIFYTIAVAIATYHLAKQQFLFVYNGIISTTLFIVGVIIWHSDILTIVNILIVSSFIFLALNMFFHVFYKDVSGYLDEEDERRFGDFEKIKNNSLQVSICVPAYNEEKNIGKLLEKLLNQSTKIIKINKIIVVSSASTDKTDKIVSDYAKKYESISLIRENERLGKATAINSFLKIAKDPVVVVQSADTLPMEDTIEKLCRPFLIDKNIGMTGGAPIPLNDKNTFLGYVIHTWWWFHRRIPRFGEIIAFKNIIKEVSPRTAVDEAYIQAKFAQLGYKNVHIDEAKIFNKGSENIKDIVKQRRRIFNGHTRLNKEENIHISHVSKSGLKLLLFEYKVYGPVQFIWLCGGILIELWANVLGRYDKYVHKINPVAWEVAHSTKDLGVSKK